MLIEDVFNNKEFKTKEKTKLLTDALLDEEITIEMIIDYSETAKGPIKGTCMEVFESATSKRPEISTHTMFVYAQTNLLAKAPRLKWESAKVIGNIAHLYPDQLETSINELLRLTSHKGTVVRWSAAYALSRIVILPKYSSTELVEQLKEISVAEEKASIKKIYEKSLKKIEL